MKYKVNHSTKYTYEDAVPVGQNVLHLTPRSLPYQKCEDFQLMIHPDPNAISRGLDYFGNHVAYFSIDHPHFGLTVVAKSTVTVEPRPVASPEASTPWEDVRAELKAQHTADSLDALQFAFASPNAAPFGDLLKFTEASFTPRRPILEALLDLTTRIFQEYVYDPRATTIHTPIEEVFASKHGVCQDFAHLQIACLRCLGLPARYVSGYLRTIPPPGKERLVGADASHAWLSLYCGELGWVDVDPTNDVLVSTDHITMAWGRDYTDVCPIQGVIVGGGVHKMHVSVDIAPVGDPQVPPASQALSPKASHEPPAPLPDESS